jgi:hypothetical protein
MPSLIGEERYAEKPQPEGVRALTGAERMRRYRMRYARRWHAIRSLPEARRSVPPDCGHRRA